MDQIVQKYLGPVFPAAAVVVLVDGDMVENRAWGWIDQHPVTPEARFDLASLTKLFTMTAFLSLVSAAKVALDDPLVGVVPAFGAVSPRPIDGGVDPHSKQPLPIADDVRGQTVDPATVTFRHLLTHTSGLAAWRDVYRVVGPPAVAPDQVDPLGRETRWARAVDALCGYPFIRQPGERVVYSDLGLMLLGEAVSRLHNGESGQLDVAVKERVLKPLDLTGPVWNPMRNGVDRALLPPTEYDAWRQRRCWGEVHDENAYGVGGVAGHAGLFATARDVATFGHSWLVNDPRLGIDPALMNAAKQVQAETEGERRGLGWIFKAPVGSSMGDRFSPNSFGHTGFTGTSLFIDPERRLVVATMTNRVYPGREVEGIYEFRRELHDWVVDQCVSSD